MLHDTIDIKKVVDSEAALEFMKEATKLATSSQLEGINVKLEEKFRLFSKLLGPGHIHSLTEEEFFQIVRRIFSIRRKAKRMIRENGFPFLREEMAVLLYGSEPTPQRINRFTGAIRQIEDKMRINFAGELLHYTQPDQYWLWTNWILDPFTGIGALSLVSHENVIPLGGSFGETYMNVGKVMSLVSAQGHITGFTNFGGGGFGINVFLACVYAVYMYTVFKVKLSREFNRILPELPELTQRVLGVY